MRLTVMGQYAKGLDTTQERRQEILKLLESVTSSRFTSGRLALQTTNMSDEGFVAAGYFLLPGNNTSQDFREARRATPLAI